MSRVLRRTQEFWRQVVAISLAWIAGVKALDSILEDSRWMLLASMLLTWLTLAGLHFAWVDERRRSPVLVAPPTDLVSPNLKWLSEQGKVVVVTRDMSWAVDPDLTSVLRTKAGHGDLVILASRRTQSLDELLAAGAQVVIDPALPSVRFTVLRYGAADARVLVHRQVRGEVEFREFGAQAFPVFHLCMDLVSARLNSQRSTS